MNEEHSSAIAFSSRGNTRWIVVRGPWGRAFDRALVRVTGFSLITWQYSKAGGNPYQPTLLLTTIGRKSGRLRTRALPYYPDDDGPGGPSGPRQSGEQGPSGPRQSGEQGPSGPRQSGEQGPSGPRQSGEQGPSGPRQSGEQGGSWVVIGSNGGGPRDPDWAWNVRANAAAWVCVRRKKYAVRAHIATGEERQRLFDSITSRRDSLSRYQERAATFGREVPLVVLQPIKDE